MGLVDTALGIVGVSYKNDSEDPIQGMNYVVIIGTNIATFSKVSGIRLLHRKVGTVNEGGMLTPYLVEEQDDETTTMTLEKGLGTLDLYKYCKNSSTMIIVVKDRHKDIKAVYYTSRMFVSDISISDLAGNSSEIVIQKMQVTYTSMMEVNPSVLNLAITAVDTVGNIIDNVVDTVKDIFDGPNEAVVEEVVEETEVYDQKAADQAIIDETTARLKAEKEAAMKKAELKRLANSNPELKQAMEANDFSQMDAAEKEAAIAAADALLAEQQAAEIEW